MLFMEKLINIDMAKNVCTQQEQDKHKSETKPAATQPIRSKWNDRKIYCLLFSTLILSRAAISSHSLALASERIVHTITFLLIIIHQITYFAINMKHSSLK